MEQQFKVMKAMSEGEPMEIGSGLYRTGGPTYKKGGVSPGVAAALGTIGAPVLAEIGKVASQGIPWLGKQAISGISKVGSWFKKLLGFGLMRTGGAMLHQSCGGESGGKMSDVPLQYQLQTPAMIKARKRLDKVKGGVRMVEGDITRFIDMLKDNESLQNRLIRKGRKPHKILNLMQKELGYRTGKKKA